MYDMMKPFLTIFFFVYLMEFDENLRVERLTEPIAAEFGILQVTISEVIKQLKK